MSRYLLCPFCSFLIHLYLTKNLELKLREKLLAEKKELNDREEELKKKLEGTHWNIARDDLVYCYIYSAHISMLYITFYQSKALTIFVEDRKQKDLERMQEFEEKKKRFREEYERNIEEAEVFYLRLGQSYLYVARKHAKKPKQSHQSIGNLQMNLVSFPQFNCVLNINFGLY